MLFTNQAHIININYGTEKFEIPNERIIFAQN